MVTRPDGRDGIDPITGMQAVWIHADGREVAELAGCQVLDASAVVAGHFGEIVHDHADELLTREQIERLIERVRSTAPTLAAEVVPGLLRPGELQRVLQNLLRERVSIRDLETILETLAVHAGKAKDIELLIETVRQSLARQITERYKAGDGRLRVVTLSKPLDAQLTAAGSQGDVRTTEALGDDMASSIVRAVAVAVGTLVEAGFPPVIVTSAPARAVLKDLTRADLPRLVVLSHRELPRDTPIEILGTVIEEESEAVTTFSTTETMV
jgi:flagellar biosynthesis protein FlhA